AMAYHSKSPEATEVREFLRPGFPFLEAQVVDASDSLAYNTHDLDDALSVGLIALDDLAEVEFWQRTLERVYRRHGEVGPEQLQSTVVRALINWQVEDLMQHTTERLKDYTARTVAAVRAAPELL